jgi:hypothetical protein
MNESEIKNRIIELFSMKRSNPKADFEDSHFLDYLTYPEHSQNNIKNTFRGVRAYYNFMALLELEFEVCFTLSDLDTLYSIDSLTKKVKDRISKRRGNLMILKIRNEETDNYYIELILLATLILTYLWLGLHLISFVSTIICGIIIYWILSSKIRARLHNKRLTKKLTCNK